MLSNLHARHGHGALNTCACAVNTWTTYRYTGLHIRCPPMGRLVCACVFCLVDQEHAHSLRTCMYVYLGFGCCVSVSVLSCVAVSICNRNCQHQSVMCHLWDPIRLESQSSTDQSPQLSQPFCPLDWVEVWLLHCLALFCHTINVTSRQSGKSSEYNCAKATDKGRVQV